MIKKNEPPRRIELLTPGLRDQCSATELRRQLTPWEDEYSVLITNVRALHYLCTVFPVLGESTADIGVSKKSAVLCPNSHHPP